MPDDASTPPAKKELIPVPDYQGLRSHSRPMTLSLSDARGRRPAADKAEVVAYLRSDRWMAYMTGSGTDCFDGNTKVDMTTVTDGTYSWCRALAYYVERYDVYLAPSFEAHMAATLFRLPTNIDTRLLKLRPFVEPTADDLADLAVELDAYSRVEEAELAYRRVLDAHANHVRSLRLLATICLRVDRVHESIDLLGRAIAVNDKDADAWFLRGLANGELARLNGALRAGIDAIVPAETAITDLRRAIELGHALAHSTLRSSYGLDR